MEIYLCGIIVKVHVFVSIFSKELLDMRLLVGIEFELTELIAVILTVAAEIFLHRLAQGLGITHLDIEEERIESPCHFHHTQRNEPLALSISQNVRKHSIVQPDCPVLAFGTLITETLRLLLTLLQEAINDSLWSLAFFKGGQRIFPVGNTIC